MFVIKCPYCGERDQTEFSCHGEAHIARPDNPAEVSDEDSRYDNRKKKGSGQNNE